MLSEFNFDLNGSFFTLFIEFYETQGTAAFWDKFWFE